MLIFAALALAAFTTFGAEPNAAGVWKWTLTEQTGETILTLKQDGEKLTGSYTNQFGKAEIADGSLKDGGISFKVKRELNGQAFVIKYSGKLSGDKITGKAEFDFDGETRALDWNAKRDSAKAAAASGNWNSLATWEQSNDGGATWIAATTTPTSANSDSIVVRSGHTVTSTADLTIDQATIDSGGTVLTNSGTQFVIADGAGADLTTNGTITASGTPIVAWSRSDGFHWYASPGSGYFSSPTGLYETAKSQ